MLSIRTLRYERTSVSGSADIRSSILLRTSRRRWRWSAYDEMSVGSLAPLLFQTRAVVIADEANGQLDQTEVPPPFSLRHWCEF